MRFLTPRRRRDLADEARQEAADERYEQFLLAFGPAENLNDAQIAALADYCSDVINQDLDMTVAELLRGRAWDWRNDEAFDQAFPEQSTARVQLIAGLV